MPQDIEIDATPRTTTSRISYARIPPMFDGSDKSKFETFLDALINYAWAYESEFDSEKKIIAFTISLLGKSDGTPCPASNWVRNWRKRNMRTMSLSETYTFKEFLKELEQTFKDQNVKQSAHLRLTTTRQGKSSLADFIQAFELNAEEAGYTPNAGEEGHHDTFLVETLESLVNEEVRDQLYTGGVEIPADYAGLKARLTTIGAVMERKRLRAAQQSRMFWTPAQKNAPAVKQNAPGFGPAPNLAKKIGPGETAPMDVDKTGPKRPVFKCYNCGQEGHMKRDCPAPRAKFNIRSIKTEDYSQEDLQALAANLREKGF